MKILIIILFVLFIYLMYLNSRYSVYLSKTNCIREGILYIDYYAIIEDKINGYVRREYLFTREKQL